MKIKREEFRSGMIVKVKDDNIICSIKWQKGINEITLRQPFYESTSGIEPTEYDVTIEEILILGDNYEDAIQAYPEYFV